MLFKQARWRELYRTYTPRFRASCPYARWLAGTKEARRQLGTDFVVRNVRVRVRGNRAAVTYETVDEGRVHKVTSSSPDIYVRIGGRWLDELDSQTTCG